MITQERLKELLHYDPETGIFTRKIAASNRVRVGDVAGTLSGGGYVYVCVDGHSYRAHRLAWLYTYGTFPSDKLDHEDRDRSNNRISNLRPATQKQNCENVGLQVNNTSGFRGVSWNKAASKWSAAIKHNYRRIHLGLFNTAEEASAAFESAANKLFTHHKKAA